MTAGVSKRKGAAKPTGAERERTEGIVALMCENSAYAAFEGARGSVELKGVEAVRLPCAGRAEAGHILKLLERGCGGVLVMGCPRDDCSFVKGNCRAERRVASIKQALREAGLNDAVVGMAWVSSLDRDALLEAVRRFKRSL
jgi:F420-non-reducing hydrogenase iron-sulfur subunit